MEKSSCNTLFYHDARYIITDTLRLHQSNNNQPTFFESRDMRIMPTNATYSRRVQWKYLDTYAVAARTSLRS